MTCGLNRGASGIWSPARLHWHVVEAVYIWESLAAASIKF